MKRPQSAPSPFCSSPVEDEKTRGVEIGFIFGERLFVAAIRRGDTCEETKIYIYILAEATPMVEVRGLR